MVCTEVFYVPGYVKGTRLLKPGMDGHYAVVLDLVWETNASPALPEITVDTVRVADWSPCPDLQQEVGRLFAF